ncbi:MAG TPA: hypothetical protein VEA35_15210 [Ramlibacter sp.]|nr:hypothetical protein [Ramlibacter sp.]
MQTVRTLTACALLAFTGASFAMSHAGMPAKGASGAAAAKKDCSAMKGDAKAACEKEMKAEADKAKK